MYRTPPASAPRAPAKGYATLHQQGGAKPLHHLLKTVPITSPFGQLPGDKIPLVILNISVEDARLGPAFALGPVQASAKRPRGGRHWSIQVSKADRPEHWTIFEEALACSSMCVDARPGEPVHVHMTCVAGSQNAVGVLRGLCAFTGGHSGRPVKGPQPGQALHPAHNPEQQVQPAAASPPALLSHETQQVPDAAGSSAPVGATGHLTYEAHAAEAGVRACSMAHSSHAGSPAGGTGEAAAAVALKEEQAHAAGGARAGSSPGLGLGPAPRELWQSALGSLGADSDSESEDGLGSLLAGLKQEEGGQQQGGMSLGFGPGMPLPQGVGHGQESSSWSSKVAGSGVQEVGSSESGDAPQSTGLQQAVLPPQLPHAQAEQAQQPQEDRMQEVAEQEQHTGAPMQPQGAAQVQVQAQPCSQASPHKRPLAVEVAEVLGVGVGVGEQGSPGQAGLQSPSAAKRMRGPLGAQAAAVRGSGGGLGLASPEQAGQIAHSAGEGCSGGAPSSSNMQAGYGGSQQQQLQVQVQGVGEMQGEGAQALAASGMATEDPLAPTATALVMHPDPAGGSRSASAAGALAAGGPAGADLVMGLLGSSRENEARVMLIKGVQAMLAGQVAGEVVVKVLMCTRDCMAFLPAYAEAEVCWSVGQQAAAVQALCRELGQ